MIKARCMMKVLRSMEGEIIDAKHPDYSQNQNIGLFKIVSPASLKKVERSGQMTVRGRSIKRLWITDIVPYVCMPLKTTGP